MSNFEKLFKSAVEGHEVPFDPSAWDKLSQQLPDPMKDAFRNAVEGHEAPFNPNAWNAIKGSIGTSSALYKWIGGSAAVLAIAAAGFFFLPSDDKEEIAQPIAINQPSVSNNQPVDANLPVDIDNPTLDSELEDQIRAQASTVQNVNAPNKENIESIENKDVTTVPKIDNSSITTDLKDLNGDDTEIKDGSVTLEDKDQDLKEPVKEIISYQEFAYFELSEGAICANEEITFSPFKPTKQLSYVWNFGDGISSNQSTSSHKFKAAGEFDVTLVVIDRNTNENLATYSQVIQVNPSPSAAFTNKNQFDTPTVLLSATANQNCHYSWKINNQLFADKSMVEYTFREKGNYQISLTATNNFGCSVTESENIEIENDFNLYAPNAFSPSEITNNTFIPKALEVMNKEFRMVIYNRAKQMVYETSNANQPWDGIDMRTNAQAPNEVYTWVVYLKNANGTTDRYYGQITKL